MTEANRDPDAIEQDIRQTQDDMSRTVERISDQLSVQNLLGSVFGTGDGGSHDSRKLVEAGKRNPVALAMIAGGFAWLLSGKEAKMPSFGSSGTEGSQQGTYDPEHRDYLSYIGQVQPNEGEDQDTYQRRRDLARCNYFMVERQPGEDDTSLRQRLDQATESFRQKRSAFAEQARRAGEQVSSGASHAVDKGQDLYQQNPWAGGLLAAAAGALAGSILPLSRAEQEQLGELGGKVRDMAGEQKERLTSELRERKDQLVGELRERKDDLVDQAEQKLSDAGQSGQPAPPPGQGQGASSAPTGTAATSPQSAAWPGTAGSSPQPPLPVS